MPEPLPSGAVPEQTLATQHGAASAPIGETLLPPSAPATMIAPPSESKLVAGYVVERELGRGAMGVVYQARDGKLGRVVALKMILAGAHADIEDMQRFLSEAQAVANLQHPNIVQVHEIGREGDLPFFTLEFVPGGTLAARLKGEPQPPRAAAHIVELLARGVEHAHKAGIIHRDLKPANVLLVEDAATPLEQCTPKIADFGLAKRIEGGTGMTQSGAIMGTPSYMAPEQAGGKTREVGPLSDVYALGAMLYEMLTGRPPFRATSTAETLLQVIADEPVTVRQLQPKSPRDLATICHKCLQKDPARRYASAAELADDLARFQKSEPIRARPVGRVERTWRWCQRNPVVAALLVLVSLASVFSLWQWRSAVAALEQVRAEQQARALAQVTALGEAVPAAVPGVLQELAASREITLPSLRQRWRDETTRGKRMRVGLALLPVEPDAVRDELAKWMLEVKEPDEAVLVRDVLAAQGTALSPALWRTAEDVKAKAAERFRCLVALAGFEPEDKRWPGLAKTAIAEMVASNPLHLRTWVQALRPVRASLLTPLQEVYRTGTPERREFAAIVLSDYAAAEPGLLADLLLDADPKQYAVLFPVLQQHRQEMIARMQRAVRGEEFWTDAPLDAGWAAVSAETRRQIESADGLVADRWAMCQTLPLEQLAAVTDSLRASGYRPVRVRPWVGVGPASRAGPVRVAAVWTRDGRTFAVEAGLPAVQPKDGLSPVDVAAYQDGPHLRFAAVWVKPAANEKAGFYAGVPADKHQDTIAGFQQDGFGPLTLHALRGADGSTTYSGVWGSQSPKGGLATWNNDADSHRGRILLADRVIHDVSVSAFDAALLTPLRLPLVQLMQNTPLGVAVGYATQPALRYATVWHADPKREAEQTHGLSVGANLERCRELAAQGYRPAALAVAVLTEGKTTTASVWQRPAPERLAREQLARRQATGAATLLQVEPAEEAWALFRQRPDAEARSQLIWRGQLLGLKASQLVRRLEEEKDVSAKRALVLALGEYDAEQLPESERRPLVAKLLQLYRDDPDAGLHGAIDWLLRHAKEGPADRRLNWDQAKALAEIDKQLVQRDTTGASPVAPRPDGGGPGGTTRGWYVNGQGQTMIKVVGPVEFRMGSPPSDPERFGDHERPHRRRIPRNFAIGARSVTITEFQRFLKDRPDVTGTFTNNYSPDPQGPTIGVSWLIAAQYCNWLSEKEGLPETEWCYPKHADIKVGMELPKDHLQRKGYRLPREAEWEYLARAGAGSSRCYGSSLELLPRYAWLGRNAEDRAWPVGQKRPNDAGLFDIHGNVWNWTLNRWVFYPEQRNAIAIIDSEDIGDIKDTHSRVLRGGSFSETPTYVRLPSRIFIRPSIPSINFGFRVARTIVNDGPTPLLRQAP